MSAESSDNPPEYEPEDYQPPVDAVIERKFIIQDIRDAFDYMANVSAYTMNPQFETVTVLVGQVDQYDDHGEMLYENTHMMLIRHYPDVASVLIRYDDNSLERVDYVLDYKAEFEPFLSQDTANIDSDIRFFLERTCFCLDTSQQFLDYLRVNQVPDLYDIAQRVREVDGPEVQRPPAA